MKRWLGLLSWLLAGLAAAAAVFLFLVLQPFSLFSIHNSGDSPKTLKVVAAERTVWKGDLPAGATRFRLSIVDRDTDIALTCSATGKKPLATQFGYLTNGRSTWTRVAVPDCANPSYDVHTLP